MKLVILPLSGRLVSQDVYTLTSLKLAVSVWTISIHISVLFWKCVEALWNHRQQTEVRRWAKVAFYPHFLSFYKFLFLMSSRWER